VCQKKWFGDYFGPINIHGICIGGERETQSCLAFGPCSRYDFVFAVFPCCTRSPPKHRTLLHIKFAISDPQNSPIFLIHVLLLPVFPHCLQSSISSTKAAAPVLPTVPSLTHSLSIVHPTQSRPTSPTFPLLKKSFAWCMQRLLPGLTSLLQIVLNAHNRSVRLFYLCVTPVACISLAKPPAGVLSLYCGMRILE
jgi:hypothetical protein